MILMDSMKKMPNLGSLWYYVEMAYTGDAVENKNSFIWGS